MKRFSLKVSQNLFDLIKKNGTQQAAVDVAVDTLLSETKILETNSKSKLEKQISFSLEEEDITRLHKTLGISTSRQLLKNIRNAIDFSLRRKSKVGLFLKDLDQDLQDILKKRIRDEWTHDSNSIEGNTLSLGETSFILNEGLTVSGKSLREHDEVRGHANAIELIYFLANSPYLSVEDLFELHRAVMVNPPFDIDNPVGAWKRKENGAYWGREFIPYPSPSEIPHLMKLWLQYYNSLFDPETPTEVVKIYTEVMVTFTAIHPFFDGNGRMARLLANLKVLRQGFVPITIDSGSRFQYLEIIKNFKLKEPRNGLETTGEYELFEKFVYSEWQKTLKIVDEMREIQRSREKM
ncbi:MAG: Fic family protein [Lentisphaeraceae bacterium]|nr:Fic family protein [Lentisphaeraceae bacterium]